MRISLPTLRARLRGVLPSAFPSSSAAPACLSAVPGSSFGGSPASGEGGNAAAGATAAGAATAGSAGQEDGELGDERPGMTLSELEEDEAEHYAVRAHVSWAVCTCLGRAAEWEAGT